MHCAEEGHQLQALPVGLSPVTQLLHPVYELHEPHVETPLPEEHVADAGLMHCAEEGHQLQAPPLELPPEMQLWHPMYELHEPHEET